MLTVERAALVAALTQATKAVESRNTYPILANVLLSADGERLTIRATDLDVEITTSVAATGELPTTTAPARTLLDIAKRMPAGAEISLALDGEHLVVKSGRSRFKLATIDPEAFPELSIKEYAAEFEADLFALFGPVAFAMSTEQTRHYLCGIFMHNPGSELRAVATDGHRLARQSAETVGDIPSVIVPAKTVGIIPQGTVQVSLSDTRIRIVQDDTTIVSKLIEGSFPDYERVTPKNNDKLLTVDRSALSAAVERVSIIASDRGGKAVKLSLADGSVTLSVTNEGGHASDELGAEFNDEPFDIGYNARYLVEMLRAVSGETVTFALNDSGSPALITGANDNWAGVLMPMRVG